MKKILNIFFVTLGVIFFLLILFSVYLYITDPLNLKPLFLHSGEFESTAAVDTGEGVDSHPLLNEAQEATLETLGVDPASLPTQITPEQAACFEEVLGQARVDEIIEGDMPTPTEFFAARHCMD